jgi:hypothetical protein
VSASYTSATASTIPDEAEIDIALLRRGDDYPGRYQGREYSTDRHGNVLDLDGRVASNPQGVPDLIAGLRGSPGRFRVTARDGAILVRVPLDAALAQADGQSRLFNEAKQLAPQPEEEKWVTVFLGTLGEQFRFEPADGEGVAAPPDADVAKLRPGDVYRGPSEPSVELRFRQRGGGTVARRVRGGELFASGPSADALTTALRDVSRREGPISRFWVNDALHAFWREEGQARFIAALSEPLEFPGDEGEGDQ